MNIRFEPLSESHFSLLLKWLKLPHIKKWWDEDVSYTIDLVREKYGSYVQGYKEINGINEPISSFVIYIEQNPIGYVQIYNAYNFPRSKPILELPENLGAIDVFIGEEKALGRNLGSKIIVEFLKAHGSKYSHIFVDPDSNNIAAIKCYEKAGFKRVAEHDDTAEIWMLKRIQNVRLSNHDLTALEICFAQSFLQGDRLWLFGSRVDLTKKGGDIDLYIETYAKTAEEAVKMRAEFLTAFEEKIGEQKIDVILNMLNNPYPLPIHEVAKTEGVRII